MRWKKTNIPAQTASEVSKIAIVKANGRDANNGGCGFIENGDRFKKILREMCQKDTVRKVVMTNESA